MPARACPEMAQMIMYLPALLATKEKVTGLLFPPGGPEGRWPCRNCGEGVSAPGNAGGFTLPAIGLVVNGMISALCGTPFALFVKVTVTLSPIGTVTVICPLAAPSKLKP